MRSFLSIISSVSLLLAAAQQVSARAEDVFKKARVIERRNPRTPFQHPKLAKRAEQFLNNKTQSFAVNGTGIPEVPFDIGESYAGLLPISGAANETRELFFWFFPTTNPNKTEELTIWFNGGPGCSSLSGLLTENGPFTWEAGTLAPVQNPYTWVNLTNVVWVEQPVGTGFTQGKPNITNEFELGDQFIGFYKNFVDLFDLHSWKVYLTGESYAGYYVPYIANSFIGANDTDYYNLKGIAINDPIIGDETIQQQIVLKPYVDYWQNVIYLNNTYREQLTKVQQDCGYADYLEKYFTFPAPNGTFAPPPDPYNTHNDTCDVFDNLYSAILEVNPCFNIYHITETCPHPYSQLGIVNEGDYQPPGAEVYFNRTDVKQAIHAPVDTNWEQCGGPVFAGRGNDYSDGPAQNGVLQRVIEHTNNVIIGSGNLDFLLSTNGTLFALQNVTWNGQQGFSQYPSQNDFFVPYHPEYNGGALSGSGIVGSWGTERGLTFYQVQLAGHELPGYAPGAGYRSLELLLGRIKDLSQGGDFTTQTGNFTGNSTGTAAVYRGRFNNIIT